MQTSLLTHNSAEPSQNRLVIKNDIHEVTQLGSFLKAVFERMNLDPSAARQFRLAVEESVVNVIQYAYPIGTEGEVEVMVLAEGDAVKVQIIDAGQPFDPTAQDVSDISLSAEERQIGGLGIHLMRELVDSICYERIEGKNVLTLIQFIIHNL